MTKPFLLGALAVLIAAGVALFLWAFEAPVPAPGEGVRSTTTVQETRGVVRQDAFDVSLLTSSIKDKAATKDDDIFAGGAVVCDSCGDAAEKVELRDIQDAPRRIARILESMKEGKGMRDCDPRVAQLVALGDGAVDDLLEAFDAVNAERTVGGDSRGAARGFALEFALKELLTAKDKEIILTYFEERAYFGDLAVKFRFPEAGEIALRRLQGLSRRSGNSFWSSADAGIAAALYPSEAIPFMMQQINEKPYLATGYIVALAKEAPQVDLRQQLIQTIASENRSYSSSQLAPLALERGLPEGFDAAVRVLRDGEMSYAHQRILDSVREHAGFAGTAEQTVQWIEQNRPRLFWSESGQRFVLR